jgi:7-cyano-7-deazaguanine synthase
MTESVTAVLVSGGLDSAVLLGEEAARQEVQPIYVSVGLAWEAAERNAVRHFLEAAPLRRLRPLISLRVEMGDVYPTQHWARTGQPPGYHTPDEDVYLPGRNVILLSKAAVFCAAAGIPRIVIGTLGHNPFPDATPAFREAMATALSLGLAHPLQIEAPYAELRKAAVIERGRRHRLPLELTLSCMNPQPTAGPAGHCGRCSKCRERHDAFVEAGIADPTDYGDRQFVRV